MKTLKYNISIVIGLKFKTDFKHNGIIKSYWTHNNCLLLVKLNDFIFALQLILWIDIFFTIIILENVKKKTIQL